ncbi:hypothetical protein GJ744_004939 [Endocarpon pusillum]|uniref:Uncharacterized protein n=1 Tax=Endocarpon pusillum TaxID=364733 RepID=A0A8H7E1E1_9EURO|nr:hypothetical protein GJ744_004939 [Endocarpon pusillum]
MARFLSSPFLLLFLLASASATTTISFYQKNSCASNSPSAGDDFTSSNLVAGSGICYHPPINTIALGIDEIEDGCSITAYLDTTCSMPTSEALATTNSPCYFLGPEEHIGSFKASCSRTITSTNESTSHGHGDSNATPSPGLQSTPTNGGSSRVGAVSERWAGGGGWVEVAIKTLMAMGAMEVVWGWGML